MAKKTGKGGSATIDGNSIAFTKWTESVAREMATATDSSSYNVATDTLHTSRSPGEEGSEIKVEGNFDLAVTGTQILSKLRTTAAVPCVLKLDATTTYCSGNYWLSDVETSLEVPGSTMITFSATLMSEGIVTYA